MSLGAKGKETILALSIKGNFNLALIFVFLKIKGESIHDKNCNIFF